MGNFSESDPLSNPHVRKLTGPTLSQFEVGSFTVGGEEVMDYVMNEQRTAIFFLPPSSDNWVGEYKEAVLHLLVNSSTHPREGDSLILKCPGDCAEEAAAMYYTEVCEEDGYYGAGTTCQSCPENAICPGGNRAWPVQVSQEHIQIMLS